MFCTTRPKTEWAWERVLSVFVGPFLCSEATLIVHVPTVPRALVRDHGQTQHTVTQVERQLARAARGLLSALGAAPIF